MDAKTAATIATLRQLLAQSANAGGWRYYAGNTSRIEPTCWATLALEASTGDSTTGPRVEAARRFLTGCQQPSGLLVEDPLLPPNVAFNGLALFLLERAGD